MSLIIANKRDLSQYVSDLLGADCTVETTRTVVEHICHDAESPRYGADWFEYFDGLDLASLI